jgi:hypothetical protein
MIAQLATSHEAEVISLNSTLVWTCKKKKIIN